MGRTALGSLADVPVLIDQDGVCTWRLEFERVGTGASCLTLPGVRHQGPCMPQRGHFGTLQRRQTVGGHPCQTLRGKPPPPSQPPSSQPTGSAAQPVTGSWAPRSSKYTLEPVAAVVAWLLARRRRLAYAWILHATCYRRPCVGCVLPARAGGIWSLLRMLRAPSSRCPVPQRPSEKKAGGGGGATDWPLPVTVLAHPVLLGTRSALCFWRTGGEAAT